MTDGTVRIALPEEAHTAQDYIAASIRRSNPNGDEVLDVLADIANGEARLWIAERAAAVSQFVQGLEMRLDERVWHAGGDMDDLVKVLEFGAFVCAEAGCDRLIIEETRNGWERVLAPYGFRKVTMLVKDL